MSAHRRVAHNYSGGTALCDICRKVFKSNTILNQHRRRIHGVAGSAADEEPDEQGEFICRECGTTFEWKQELKEHTKNHNLVRTKLKCDICSKEFRSNQSFQDHVRGHTTDKPFECQHCKKCFGRRSILSRHLLIHTGERPYKCTMCEKSFTQKSTRDAHLRRHSGEKPFECEMCGRCFADKSHYKRHVKHVHTQTPETAKNLVECKHCKKFLSSKNSLCRHLKVVHTDNVSNGGDVSTHEEMNESAIFECLETTLEAKANKMKETDKLDREEASHF
jgi:KRAB domain-containing zinc finger protein